MLFLIVVILIRIDVGFGGAIPFYNFYVLAEIA
jgi:hypothetical protein